MTKNKNAADMARHYMQHNKLTHARTKFESWLRKYPEDRDAYLDYGATLYSLGYPELGLAATKKAHKLDPTWGPALNNIGLYYQKYNDNAMAMQYYANAIECGYNEANFNYSLAKLSDLMDVMMLEGESFNYDYRWDEAWLAYRYRFLKNKPVEIPRVLDGVKYWDPRDSLEPVMVIAEQGVGDNIMFSRYLPMLPPGSEFAVPEDQQELFSGIPMIDSTDKSNCKYYCPIADLPLFFKTVGVIPKDNSGTEIGVCWKGSALHANDSSRSYPELQNEMLSIGTVSLQFGHGTMKSWTDTIKLVESCHTVITVDTSVAHLAARMGKRVMILQPKYDWDFRWGTGSKCVWYPGVESYKDWATLKKNI
jgi:tetratricopeptide (TPR) repeat protein